MKLASVQIIDYYCVSVWFIRWIKLDKSSLFAEIFHLMNWALGFLFSYNRINKNALTMTGQQPPLPEVNLMGPPLAWWWWWSSVGLSSMPLVKPSLAPRSSCQIESKSLSICKSSKKSTSSRSENLYYVLINSVWIFTPKMQGSFKWGLPHKGKQ